MNAISHDWRSVWRDGFAPLLSVEQLETLRVALVENDRRLVQGATCYPSPLDSDKDEPVTACCLMSYNAAIENGGFCCEAEAMPPVQTPDAPYSSFAVPKHNRAAAAVGVVEEAFAKLCFACDQRLGEPAACRHFLHWFDDVSRDHMRRELVPEIERELKRRREPTAEEANEQRLMEPVNPVA